MTVPRPEKDTQRDNAFEMGAGTLVSRTLGFARDAAIAALLGGGWPADAFLVAFRLPNFTRRLLAEGAFAYALVPGYMAAKQGGRDDAAAFLRAMTLALVGVFLLLCLVGMALAGPLARILAPGLGRVPDVAASAAVFLALCLPYLPFAAGAAVASAALMAEGNFRVPAYAPVVLNLTILAAALVAFVMYGTGSPETPYILCAGVVASGLVQWLFQAFFLARAGFSFIGPIRNGGQAGKTLKALPGSAFGASGNQINILAATMLASFLAEGSVSALYFAERLIEFPLGVIGASLGLASLAELSGLSCPEAAGRERRAAFAARLAKAVRMALFLALPAAVGTACLALPITTLIFGYGEFGPQPLANTSAALLAYAAGLPALAAARPLLAACAALRDTSAPKRAALLGLCATLLFGIASLPLNAPWGPALAVSLAAWGGFAVLVRALVRRGFCPVPARGWTARSFGASLIMAVCVLGAKTAFTSNATTVLVCIPLGAFVYFAASHALGLEEAARVAAMAARPRK